MPTGLNIATCLHCSAQWVVGDCIPCVCPECAAKGHEGFGSSCPVCHEEDRQRLERIGASIRASDRLAAEKTLVIPFDAGVWD